MAIVRGGITVKPHVQAFVDACEGATGAKDYGTYNGHSPPEGPTQALDIYNADSVVGYSLQDRIVSFAIENAKRFGIRYIIRREHIWNIERVAEGWRRQVHHGNRTADHYDHVHITFYATAPQVGPTPVPTPTPTQEGLPMEFTYITSGQDYVFSTTAFFHGKLPYGVTLDVLKKRALLLNLGTQPVEFHQGVASLADQCKFSGDRSF